MRLGVLLGMLLVLLGDGRASAASPKRVLLLNPFERDVAPFSAAVSAFRSTLTRELGEPLDLHEVPLDLARFSGPEGEGPLVGFLEGRVRQIPVDLVVAVGGAGAQFAARHRPRVFADIPLLVVAADPRLVPASLLRTNATLLTQPVSLSDMVEDILQLQPQTTNIAVVFGASPLEKSWVTECHREFQAFTNRVGFTFLNDLPLDQVLARCARLPPRSFILHGIFLVDAAGIPCEGNEALRRLHRVANAPLFGYFASEMGLGPIGGRLYRDTEVGAEGGRVAVRILRGEPAAGIPPRVIGTSTPVYDWRELRRWGIPEARLPAGSVVQFREEGFWERHRWSILGVVFFCLLQAGLIVGLLVNRARRRQGEAEATLIAEISSKFVNLPSGEVDRAILDAERRICELLGLDFSVLWQWSDDPSGSFSVSHFYSVQEGPQPPGRMREDQYPWAREQLLAGRVLRISSLDDFPPEAGRDRETLRQLGIRSNLALPLAVGGERPIGVLGLGTTRRERSWPDGLVGRLRPLAEVFANALARKRADLVLRQSEERMSMAAEAAELGIWVWNIPRNEVWGSDRWLNLLGFERGGEIRLEQVLQRVHPHDRTVVESAIRRALEERSKYVVEFRAVLPDGTSRWIASRGQVTVDGNGVPLRMVGASLDITQRRQTEREVQELRTNLAHAGRVTVLGQLASALAHELSQPLGAILRNAEAAEILLQQASPDLEELRAIVTDILRDDQRAALVINRLRSLLKRGNLALQPVDLSGLIDEVLLVVQADAAARHVSIECSVPPALPPVRGDRIHLQQVLLNLLVNAMDALEEGPAGHRCIQVSARCVEPSAVEVRVADNGPGVPPEALGRLFDPFYTTKAHGMGMGLAVSRTILEAHRGRLWAEPGPGTGACFCFTVPAATGPGPS